MCHADMSLACLMLFAVIANPAYPVDISFNAELFLNSHDHNAVTCMMYIKSSLFGFFFPFHDLANCWWYRIPIHVNSIILIFVLKWN